MYHVELNHFIGFQKDEIIILMGEDVLVWRRTGTKCVSRLYDKRSEYRGSVVVSVDVSELR